jgi:uroporphyrinogen-III synthase
MIRGPLEVLWQRNRYCHVAREASPIPPSPQAASVFLEVALSCQSYQPTNVVAIGEATGEILRKAGATIVFSPSKSLAKVLGDELPLVPGGSHRVLYPASRRAASTLEDKLSGRGFEVVRLNTYDTVPAEWTPREEVGAARASTG